ncbi:dihydrodipicolinate synthase [Thermoplasma volcanium GSS1]|uniref:Dihydrodipicolinate synthase n=1 Tax=Thermoplasma volcanium (strain ATCC 51530 / DSM 4299 / JCM 9571 / NBRC 15438 / GSS1) TaxID=273116 RepID=Q97AZ1_THEVO|nr:dihydrodipicolinate synthase family protein [Thermoplasma volcanium]BAB59810.1 dihydrodipicolinate synthase [Thermoplasma volcanium GSS1]
MKLKIVPVVTPFKEGKIDGEKFIHHCMSLLSVGVNYVFISGTTGLGPSLSINERMDLIKLSSNFADKAIMQVGSMNLEDSIKLARMAKENGIYGISALPPYYFGGIPEEWLIKYYVEISKIIPTFIYNYPKFTGYDINSSLAIKINKAGGNIIGVKDTIADISHMLSYRDLGNDFIILSGPSNSIYEALRSGVDGSVAAAGNFMPKTFIELADKFEAEASFKLQKYINSVLSIANEYGSWSAYYSLIKILRRYSAGDSRAPFYPLNALDEEKLRHDVFFVLPEEQRHQ